MPDGLRIETTSTFRPEVTPPSPLPWIAGGALVVLLLGAALAFRSLKLEAARLEAARLEAARLEAARLAALPLDPVVATPPDQLAAALAPTGSVPVPLPTIVLLAVLEDKDCSIALRKQLGHRGVRVCDPYDESFMPPGAEIRATMLAALDGAQVIAILTSADLFAAAEPWKGLLAHAVALHRDRGVALAPVSARASGWDQTELGGLRPLPAEGSIDRPDNAIVLDAVARALTVLARKAPTVARAEGAAAAAAAAAAAES